jgi:hypothetical protein
MNDIQVPARTGLPAHTRLVLIHEDLLGQMGSRTNEGYAITAEWGDPRPEGWYEPTFTAHYDQPIGMDVERLVHMIDRQPSGRRGRKAGLQPIDAR